MPIELVQYFTFSFVSIAVCLFLAFLFYQRRASAGAIPMSIAMLLIAGWALMDLISALCTAFTAKVFFHNLAYIGITLIPVTWMGFSLEYIRDEKHLKPQNGALLTIIPLFTLIFIFTNDAHHQVFSSMRLQTLGSLTIVLKEYGPWFWVHAAYSYLLILLGTFLLMKKLFRLPGVYRKQALIMLVAVLLPLVGNVLYLLNLLPSQGVDPTAFSFSFSGIFYFWGLFRFKLLDLVPAARDAVIESMSDLLIILDDHDRIVDMNSSAKRVFGTGRISLIGQHITYASEEKLLFFKKYDNVMKANEKIFLDIGTHSRCYDLRIAPLYGRKGVINGRFVIMRDVSVLEYTLEELHKSRKEALDANNAKSRLLAAISQEIRTPLKEIIRTTEMLSSSNLTSDGRENINTIQYSANLINGIINNVLNFSQMQGGKMNTDNFNTNSGQPKPETAVSLTERTLRILLVEDNKINQKMITRMLENQNWKVITAENGIIALEKLEESSFDLILMDVQMPEMDGHEAARRIREKEKLSGGHIPIIALTADTDDSDRAACLESGMDDYLSKPVKPQSLYSCMEKYI